MKRKELFSDFLRKKRLEKGLGLREFARLIKMQPSNYCNVESGSLPPPADKLNLIAASLDLQKGSSDYRKFMDLASNVRDEIPSDIQELIRKSSLIPSMLRTIEDHEVKPEQLKRIIKDIRSGRYRQKS
jgi:transcriptional regulator with XRE-family HTH domain